jgi:hypothetical protein
MTYDGRNCEAFASGNAVDPDGSTIKVRGLATRDAEIIFDHELPAWADLFIEKNRKYANFQKDSLGVKAMFVDVWRKAALLKYRIWEGEPEIGNETNREIIQDMIGHLFLILARTGAAECQSQTCELHAGECTDDLDLGPEGRAN